LLLPFVVNKAYHKRCSLTQLWCRQRVKQAYYTAFCSCFHRCKKCKNVPSNSGVIVHNKVARFFLEHGISTPSKTARLVSVLNDARSLVGDLIVRSRRTDEAER